MAYAQFGEDVTLHRLIPDGDGLYVEIGGNDGVTGSNTLFFEELGHPCLVVEPVPYLANQIRARRSCAVVEAAADEQDGEAEFLIASGGDTLSTLNNVNRALSRIDEHTGGIEAVRVRTRTLDSILEEVRANRVELISIDVEGNELSVLRGLTLQRWQPRVLIIEDNSFGRDRRVREHLAGHGYVRFRITGVNHWYCGCGDRRLDTVLHRLQSVLFAALVRIYGTVSGRGRGAASPGAV
ncbi:MAG: FkbM family methyltransferase [Spirochaetaceae bacterium]|nr:MAG: FkbM family methyltransferase [Spirochaetaceae bacterium]